MAKGGYTIIDFGGVDISTNEENKTHISNIYKKALNTINKNKPIILLNVKFDTYEEKFAPIYANATRQINSEDDSFSISWNFGVINFYNDNTILGEEV